MPQEIGYQAPKLSSWWDLGFQALETNPAMVWPKSVDVFDKMRREDAQVGSVLRAVTYPIRRTEWTVDPSGARDEVVELVAGDLGIPVKGSSDPVVRDRESKFSWESHLALSLLELVYGHSVFEQVYRIDDRSRARLAKLAWRPPRTISKFDVAKDGGLRAVEQYSLGLSKVRIPIDRLVVYVNEREGGNWLGQSLLRSAYKNWLLKDRMLRAQALTVERNGLGVPVYEGAEPPADLSADDREKWQLAERDAGLAIARDFRAGDTAGASIPAGAKLTLVGVSGRLPDTDGPIRYHDEQIARAVLAHFLNLGTETGSWALGSTFADFFTESLNAVSGQIADVTQQHVVADLVAQTWGPDEPVPVLAPAKIGATHVATAESIKVLREAGALSWSDADEDHLRSTYGLPARDPEAVRSVAVGAEGSEEGS